MKLKPVLVVLAAALFSWPAPSVGNDFRTSEDTSEFLGWTKDGSTMAYIRTVKDINLYGLGMNLSSAALANIQGQIRNYSMSYAAVQYVNGKKPEEFFRISGDTENVVDFPAERAAWLSGKPEGKWETFSASHSFHKSESSPVSPRGRWRIGINIEGSSVALSTEVAPFDHEMSERNVSGNILHFAAGGPNWMAQNGKWTWIGYLDDGKRRIEFHKEDLISTVTKSGGSLSGAYDGYLEAYWSPNEDWVNIQWATFPTVGGGAEQVRLYQVKLPPVK